MNSITRAQLALVALAVLIGPLVFLYLHPAVNFQNPSAARIVVLHVPMAWLATLFFLVSAAFAGRYLHRRALIEDECACAAAEIGLLCCVLATLTGSVFAHTQWGSWWNWDPKETSIFFLFLIYAAYFALRGSVEDPGRRALFSSVYDLLACLVMPFLIFVLPRITPSLHPSKAHMDGSYWLVLFVTFFGFGALFTWVLTIRCAVGSARLNKAAEPAGPVEPLRPTLVNRNG